MSDYFRAILSPQQYKSWCETWKFSQDTERGEKGREKGLGVSGKEKEKQKDSVLLFHHTLIFFSFIPSVEGRSRVQKQDQEQKAALLCFGTPDRVWQGGQDIGRRIKPSLTFAHLPFTACLLGTSLDNSQGLVCSNAHQQNFWQNRFSGKNIDSLTPRCFNL